MSILFLVFCFPFRTSSSGEYKCVWTHKNTQPVHMCALNTLVKAALNAFSLFWLLCFYVMHFSLLSLSHYCFGIQNKYEHTHQCMARMLVFWSLAAYGLVNILKVGFVYICCCCFCCRGNLHLWLRWKVHSSEKECMLNQVIQNYLLRCHVSCSFDFCCFISFHLVFFLLFLPWRFFHFERKKNALKNVWYALMRIKHKIIAFVLMPKRKGGKYARMCISLE